MLLTQQTLSAATSTLIASSYFTIVTTDATIRRRQTNRRRDGWTCIALTLRVRRRSLSPACARIVVVTSRLLLNGGGMSVKHIIIALSDGVSELNMKL